MLRSTCSAIGAALAVPAFVPSRVLGLDGAAAPSERTTLGFIGVGMMGRGHVGLLLQYPQTQILGVCDVDRWRREDSKKTVEQAYAEQKDRGSYKGCDAYNDLRDLLARQDIDAVVIATGDRWHGLATVMAAKAGKDVYCEKPMSLTIHEGLSMVEHVRRYGRVMQTGLQQRSTPEFQRACDLVRKGRIGKVHSVFVTFPGTCYDVNLPPEPTPESLDWDLWLGPAPWRPFNHAFHHLGQPKFVVPWHISPDFGGGNLTSNAVHAFDVVQWGLGMDESGPVEITPPETGEVPVLTYRYANGTQLQVTPKLDPKYHTIPKGWDPNTSFQVFGALFVGDAGWIHVGREGYLKAFPDEVLEQPADKDQPSRPVTNHHLDWLSAIRSREKPCCDVAIGCQSTIVAQLGCIAHWTRRKLQWDPQKNEFVGDPEANLMRRRTMREPWTM